MRTKVHTPFRKLLLLDKPCNLSPLHRTVRVHDCLLIPARVDYSSTIKQKLPVGHHTNIKKRRSKQDQNSVGIASFNSIIDTVVDPAVWYKANLWVVINCGKANCTGRMELSSGALRPLQYFKTKHTNWFIDTHQEAKAQDPQNRPHIFYWVSLHLPITILIYK